VLSTLDAQLIPQPHGLDGADEDVSPSAGYDSVRSPSRPRGSRRGAKAQGGRMRGFEGRGWHPCWDAWVLGNCTRWYRCARPPAPCWDASGITVRAPRPIDFSPRTFGERILSSASACRRAHGVRSTFFSSLNLAMVGACWNLLYWEDGNGGIRLR
jgi:hypothetical protein